ncbi:MAG: glycosyltransferase family 2 protein [Ferruginibacter sp.]
MNILTVCFPVYNEVKFIDSLIRSVIGTFPLDKEIVLIDGGSTDGTLEKIKSWQDKYANILLIHNKERYVSHGFNLAFKNTNSIYIALMGAHAEYPDNYFQKGLAILRSGEADAVGGPLVQKGSSRRSTVIAFCMSSKFGVGDTAFRTSKKRSYVDSVAMAIYNRNVFDKVGLFDETLIRNQDDEFHYRLNHHGFKIMMEPEMESVYYVREDLASLWKQYYYYGLYKPMVLKKVRSGMRTRHLVPAGFVVYLLALPFLLLWHWLFIIPLLIYFFGALLILSATFSGLKDILFGFFAFLTLHLSYGSGFLKGLFK